MKKLLFITTGGTIASIQTGQGLKPLLSGQELTAQIPELEQFCHADTLSLCSLDSTDMTPEVWVQMVEALEHAYDDYDGFVICHGTDTMAYTAAALSYLVRNSAKPIVLTGSQKPISSEISDAKRNLRDSAICAVSPDSRGVMLVFDGKVIAGTRAKKTKTSSYDAFGSINFPVLGVVQNDRLVRYIPSLPCTGPVEFCKSLNPRVFLLKLTPGITPALLQEVLRLYDCIIIESFGVGGLPQTIAQEFCKLVQSYPEGQKLVVMTTQVTYEGSNVGVYEVGARLKDQIPLLEAHDMTLEAVYTKMMWVMGRGPRSFAQIKRDFYSPVNFDTTYRPR